MTQEEKLKFVICMLTLVFILVTIKVHYFSTNEETKIECPCKHLSNVKKGQKILLEDEVFYFVRVYNDCDVKILTIADCKAINLYVDCSLVTLK